jgi:hypothetical protein
MHEYHHSEWVVAWLRSMNLQGRKYMTVNMKAVFSSEIVVPTYQALWYHNIVNHMNMNFNIIFPSHRTFSSYSSALDSLTNFIYLGIISTPLYPQKLTLNFVDKWRSSGLRATEFFFFWYHLICAACSVNFFPDICATIQIIFEEKYTYEVSHYEVSSIVLLLSLEIP